MSTYKPPFTPDHPTEQASVAYSPASDAAAFAAEPVWQAHQAISRRLEQQVADSFTAEAAAFGADAVAGSGNVMGVGVGISTPSSSEWTAEPGVAALRVYLREPMEESELRQLLATEFDTPGMSAAGLPVEPVVTGEITSYPHTFKERPAPGGVSVGHVDITAGTLGCLARGRTGDRRERTLILSNNHVLADTNSGSFGDVIVQPGPLDGGSGPGDQIAVLERFVPIDFTAANEVDCATGWADPKLVRRELLYLDKGAVRYFRISGTPQTAKTGDIVGKSGRTTQLTSGRVANVAATVRVRFGPRVALFRNQIEIVPLNSATGPFSAGGDSGSIIWTLDDERRPIGLLFAGGGGSTFANPISAVLRALDIELST